MPKFAANLTMLFTEVPFPDRFAKAKQAGFTTVEYLLPYAYPDRELKNHLNTNGLKQVLFNLPCGDWVAGDRGIGAHPARVKEFRAGVAQAIEYAKTLSVKNLNCLAGKRTASHSDAEHWAALLDNLKFAANELRKHHLNLLVEPVNHFDIPGFFLNKTEQVLKLLQEVAQPNVFLQYDVYHAQREEGEIINTLKRILPQVGHIQIADNPGRHEPGTGEINYPFVLREIDAMGYSGHIGLEYIPAKGSDLSFDWIKEFGFKP
jgi:hydroxypyruvate isomerase